MTSKLKHHYNILKKKLNVYYELSKNPKTKILTLDKLYEDICKLYMNTAQDMILNLYLNNIISLPEDFFNMNTREWAEIQIEVMMEKLSIAEKKRNGSSTY